GRADDGMRDLALTQQNWPETCEEKSAREHCSLAHVGSAGCRTHLSRGAVTGLIIVTWESCAAFGSWAIGRRPSTMPVRASDDSTVMPSWASADAVAPAPPEPRTSMRTLVPTTWTLLAWVEWNVPWLPPCTNA